MSSFNEEGDEERTKDRSDGNFSVIVGQVRADPLDDMFRVASLEENGSRAREPSDKPVPTGNSSHKPAGVLELLHVILTVPSDEVSSVDDDLLSRTQSLLDYSSQGLNEEQTLPRDLRDEHSVTREETFLPALRLGRPLHGIGRGEVGMVAQVPDLLSVKADRTDVAPDLWRDSHFARSCIRSLTDLVGAEKVFEADLELPRHLNSPSHGDHRIRTALHRVTVLEEQSEDRVRVTMIDPVVDTLVRSRLILTRSGLLRLRNTDDAWLAVTGHGTARAAKWRGHSGSAVSWVLSTGLRERHGL